MLDFVRLKPLRVPAHYRAKLIPVLPLDKANLKKDVARFAELLNSIQIDAEGPQSI
jgi:hypothetical protein